MADATILDNKVSAQLNRLQIEARVLDCDPDLADTAAFCDHYGFSTDQAANSILVAAKTDPVSYVACIVLATTKLDVNKSVCKLMGVRKASFASADQTAALSGMTIGGVTAIGLPENLVVYVDSRVMNRAEIVMGGGNRSSKLVLNPNELRKLSNMHVIEDLAVARPG
jgi:prolyl-tRNA editing enzyme YbaK/EbsC (Cys-tRNA(Pro) deacylase)